MNRRWSVALWCALPLAACQPSVLRQIAPVQAPLPASARDLAPAMAHVLAGDLARARGDEAEALVQYRIALVHDPDSMEIQARIAAGAP